MKMLKILKKNGFHIIKGEVIENGMVIMIT